MNVQDVPRLRIYISSPGDVEKERSYARRVISRVEKDPLWRRYVDLDVVAWDDPDRPALMQAQLTPQESVNRAIPLPSECDIAVFILWSRMGSPQDPQQQGRKPDGTPYLSGTEWEFHNALRAAKQTGKPIPLLYRRTDWPDDVDAEQFVRVREFFASLSSPEGYRKHSVIEYETPVDFLVLFDSNLKSAIQQLVKLEPSERDQTALWQEMGPYPGLRSFTLDEAAIFFGREQETEAVIDVLKHGPFAAVVGPSGCGKSSLAKAGILSRLRKGAIANEHTNSKHWVYLSCTPGGAGSGNPFESIYESMMDQFPSLRPYALDAPRAKQAFVIDILSRPEALIDIIAAALRGTSPGGHILLFIDQFEELFTHVVERYRASFIQMLASVAASPLAHTLVTLRADFYDQLAQWPAMVDLLNRGHYLLRMPGSVALSQMITLPAERAGFRFEEGLADRILDEVGKQAGTLPLMASVLQQMFRLRTAEGLFTRTSYDTIGGVRGAIQRQAGEAENRLDQAQQRVLLPQLFESLVTLNDNGIATRRTVHASSLLEGREDLQDVVDLLTDWRLLVTNAVGNKVTVEIAHEALLHHWASLAAWIQRESRTRKINWDFPRSSGVLLPITSLPGAHGIGNLGHTAHKFIDWLHNGLQTWWQVLPVGPTSWDNSPYNVLSTFAGNPLLIDFAVLEEHGWLAEGDFAHEPSFSDERIDYELVREHHGILLDRAFEKFCKSGKESDHAEFEEFCHEARFWLEDYALFAVAKEKFKNECWTEWPKTLARADASTLSDFKHEWSLQLKKQMFLQWLFRIQWTALKHYANSQGIRFLCDLPSVVSLDSADVWSHQDQFTLDEHGYPTVMSGMPPNYFSATGQIWGTPICRWETMQADGYSWWKERLRLAFRMFDVVRIASFSLLIRYWEIPGGSTTAINGRWADGPGGVFLEAMRAEFGHLPLVAEDLDLNKFWESESRAAEIRDAYKIPGIKVLQFAFDETGRDYNPFKPHWFGNNIVYTGTPDTSTVLGWWQGIDNRVKRNVEAYMGPISDPPRDLMRLAMMSAAHTVIIPLQDVLGIGDESRLNLPGSRSGNWTWRVQERALTTEQRAALGQMTLLFDRALTH